MKMEENKESLQPQDAAGQEVTDTKATSSSAKDGDLLKYSVSHPRYS